MKLTIFGGGGFRVPQIIEALAKRPQDELDVDRVTLYDVSPQRLRVMQSVLDGMPLSKKPVIEATDDIEKALDGAAFIFSTMRVGGTHGRVMDEKVALDAGVLGQETVGPGGYAYAFRTIPYAIELAKAVKKYAPEAWVINFTNPAGIITQAMRQVMGERVVGICDTPIGLVRRAGRALGLQEADFEYDYIGLNHLGWLRSITVDGADQLPRLLNDDKLLSVIEEARIIGFDWVRQIAMLPNEYLFYYYHNREAVAQIRAEKQTRGQYLEKQQEEFYKAADSDSTRAFELWDKTHRDREETYMAEAREIANEGERHLEDIEEGGYQEVALDLMTALSGGQKKRMILGVRNDDAATGLIVESLNADAVVEVPCVVDSAGIHPQKVDALSGPELGLIMQVKACENLVIEATLKRDLGLAWEAIAAHPLVDSVDIAREIVDGYCKEIPEIGAIFAK